MDRWEEGRMDGWMKGWKDGRKEGSMDGWVGGWMDGMEGREKATRKRGETGEEIIHKERNRRQTEVLENAMARCERPPRLGKYRSTYNAGGWRGIEQEVNPSPRRDRGRDKEGIRAEGENGEKGHWTSKRKLPTTGTQPARRQCGK